MSLALASLQCLPGNAFGSVKTVQVIRHAEVAYVPLQPLDLYELIEPIKVQTGTAPVGYHFERNTLKLSSTTRSGPQGTIHEYRLSAFNKKIRSASLSELAKLRDGHYVLIVEDYAGNTYLLGNEQESMRFLGNMDTQQQRPQVNGTNWLFLGAFRHPAPLIQAQGFLQVDPCSFISSSDFLPGQWRFDLSNGEFLSVELLLAQTGQIAAITNYPQATLYDPNDNQMDFYNWDPLTQSYANPDNGLNLFNINGTYELRVTLPLLLKNGFTCSYDLVIGYLYAAGAGGPVANPPQAFNIDFNFPSGNKVNGIISVSYEYRDLDGDAQNLGSTTVELWAFDQPNNGPGLLLGNLSHVPGSSTADGIKVLSDFQIPQTAEGKYLGVKITPHADNAPNVGALALYVYPDPVIQNTAAVVLPTDATAPDSFLFSVSAIDQQGYYLEYSDNAAPDFHKGTGLQVSHSKSFSTVATPHTVTVCTDPLNILGLIANGGGVDALGSQLNGQVDLSACLALSDQLRLDNNINLSLVLLPQTGSPILNIIDLSDTGITAFDLGAVDALAAGQLLLVGCTALASFTTNPNKANLLYKTLRANFTLLPDIDVHNFNTATTIAIATNNLLAAVVLPDNSTVVVDNLQLHDNPLLAGQQDLSGLMMGIKNIFYAFNTLVTGFLLPPKAVFDALAAAGDFLYDFRCQGANISTPDWSAMTNLSGRVLAGNQPLGSVTWAANPYLGTFYDLNLGSGQLVGTHDISSFEKWYTGGSIVMANNPGLHTLITPVMTTGEIDNLNLSSCAFATAAAMGLSNLIFANSGIIDLSGNSLPATEVDNALADLVAKLAPGSMTIYIHNNTAPTAAGDISAADLTADGHTVITD